MQDPTLLDLPMGRLHVREDGHGTGPPLLPIHAFAGSLHAWDPVVEHLACAHRVIRMDMLGHGHSDKPADGYAMAEQARAVVATLDRLGIARVIAVGHSGGGDVVVALVEHFRERIAGAALLGTPPNLTYVHLPLTARLFSVPLLGSIVWRFVTDDMIRDGLAKTFAPGFATSPAVYAPFVRDLRRMTHRSYVRARAAVERFRRERDLTMRVADTGVPLLIVFGDRDQWVDPRAAAHWARASAARIAILPGIGHTPLVECPEATARVLLDFAREEHPADAAGA
ncbi:MAG: alpha/beta hydrolase [Candidatus Binatia bacterium]